MLEACHPKTSSTTSLSLTVQSSWKNIRRSLRNFIGI
jgi:hypothetical protein